MKFILTYLILITPTIGVAGLTDCGEYEVRGVVRANKVSYEIVVNEKTMSQINISIPLSEQLKLLPYIDKPVILALILDKKFDGTKGFSEKIISINNRIPDPLNPKNTGLSLLKKIECNKN